MRKTFQELNYRLRKKTKGLPVTNCDIPDNSQIVFTNLKSNTSPRQILSILDALDYFNPKLHYRRL